MLYRNLLIVALLCLWSRHYATVAVPLDDWAYPFFDTTQSLRHGRHLQGDLYQSPPDSQGPSYVSAVSYNKRSKALHLVGSTYGAAWDGKWPGGTSACFYAVLTMANDSPTAAHQSIWGMPGVAQACHNVLVDEDQSRVYVVGHNMAGGLLKDQEDGGSGYGEATVYGSFLDFHYNSIETPSEGPQLAGGSVYLDEPVGYTVGVAKEAGETEVFTVTMALETLPTRDPADMTQDPTQAESFEYKGNYNMKVTAHTVNDAGDPASWPTRTLSPHWGPKSYEPDGSPLIDIAGMVKIGDNLYVGGSTAGYGQGFGRRNATGDIDTDGFVSKLSAFDGDIPTPGSTVMDTYSDPYTWRAFSHRTANERIHGLCVSENTQGYIYAVGSTQGYVGSVASSDSKQKAFLAKISIADMRHVWVQHIQASDDATQVEGISCTVAENGAAVYFAGNVRGGAVMDSGISGSYGGSDIFIAKVDNTATAPTSDQVLYVKQFGSGADDTVAQRGGLEAIEGDRVIVVGNTMGGFARSKGASEQAYSTVFAVVISKDGVFTNPSGSGVDTGGDTLPTPSLPSPGNPTTPATTQPPPMASPTAAPTPQDLQPEPVAPPPNKSESKNSDGGGGRWKALMVLLVLGIVLTAIAMCFQQYFYHKREATTDRSKVLNYLQNFDVEDVDLKHSATGGWHCSYVNDLARGINAQSNYDPSYTDRGLMADSDYHDSSFDPLNSATTSPNSPESKVLEDSLFVIDDSEEMLTFGNDRAERGGLMRNYSRKWNAGKSKSRRKSNEWGREII